MLFEFKIASANQILKYIFPTSSITNVRYRLQRLEKEKLIVSLGYRNDGHLCNLYHLTKKGLAYVVDFYQDHKSNFKLKSEVVEHDLMLLDIAQKLKSSRFCHDYLTENVLQSNPDMKDDPKLLHFVQCRSDAFMSLNFNGDKYNVAIEYENSQKANCRYEKLVSNYYLSSKVDIIFYLYQKEKIKDIICEIEEKNWKDNEPKFYFSKADSEFFDQKNVIFYDRIGSKIQI